MPDQVDLDEPGPFVVPVRPGPHRDLRLEQPAGLGQRPAAADLQLGPVWRKPPVDGGRRHRHQPGSKCVVDVELAMAAQRGDQLAHDRGEPFPSRAVEHRPHLAQRVDDLRPVGEHRGASAPHGGRRAGHRDPQRLAGVIAMPLVDLDQMVQDRGLLSLGSLRVLAHHRRGDLAAGARQARSESRQGVKVITIWSTVVVTENGTTSTTPIA